MASKKRARRKKNLSTGAWIGIGLGVAALVTLPIIAVAAFAAYGVSRIDEKKKQLGFEPTTEF